MKKDFRTRNLLSEVALDPKFVEIHDCVILDGTSAELLPSHLPESPEERQKIEHILNRREVWELFEVSPPEPSPRLLCEAGNAVVEIWESRLKMRFPNRKFAVGFEYAPPVCEVYFFQALPWHIDAEAQAKANKSSHRADWRPKLDGAPWLSQKVQK